MFSVLDRFVKRSVVIGLLYFFLFFETYMFAINGLNMLRKQLFLNIFNIASSDFNETMMPET